MKHKYPNKTKRKGFWKRYERATIKNYRKVWKTILELFAQEKTPFEFSKNGRKPNLTKEEYVAMAVLYAYFDLDFRELEYLVDLLSGKKLDHTNCNRWFGKLTQDYVNNLVFLVHKKIIEIKDVGDYIADSTKVTCDRLESKIYKGKETFVHVNWKLHILVQYIFTLGLVSIVSVFSSPGEVNDSRPLRNELLKKGRLTKGRKVHADKGYFGKENIKKCKRLGLQPNLVPKEQYYKDGFIKRYIQKDYDPKARKKTRGLVEGAFGGLETKFKLETRCRKPKNRNIHLSLLALRHNLRTYFRATSLKLLFSFATTPVSEKNRS